MTVSQDAIQTPVLLPSQVREKMIELLENLLPDKTKCLIYGKTEVSFYPHKSYRLKINGVGISFQTEGYKNNIATVVFSKGMIRHITIWILPEDEHLQVYNNDYKNYDDYSVAYPAYNFLAILEDLKTQPKTVV